MEHNQPVLAQIIANDIPKVFVEQNQELQASRYAQLNTTLTCEISELQYEIWQLQAAIADKKVSGASDGDADLLVLENDLEHAHSKSSALLRNLGDVELAEVQTGSSLLVVAEAKLPKVPVRPKPVQNTLLAMAFGAMLGLAAAFLAGVPRRHAQNRPRRQGRPGHHHAGRRTASEERRSWMTH